MHQVELSSLQPSDLGPVADFIRGLGRSAPSVEAAAQSAAKHLYDALVDAEGAPACALARVYKTHALEDLPEGVQSFARGLFAEDPAPGVRCLTLLGTAGVEEAWNSRHASQGHRAIPLPNSDFVHRLPMVAQLFAQLGLELETVISPMRPSATVAQQTYDVFHVPEALGSPYLPSQDFVAKYGVRSAVGFGGFLTSGEFYAGILFTRVSIDEAAARTLKILALPLRVALTPMIGRPVFDG